jgi:hypothetical protein
MIDATALTERFDRAMLYATHVHGGQMRTGTSIPHVAHLLAVAATVIEYGGSEDMTFAVPSRIRVENRVFQKYATASGIVSRISFVPARIVFSTRLSATTRKIGNAVISIPLV